MGSTSPWRRLFDDLRRRKVFRVAAVYAAVAFVVVQAAAYVFPALLLPEWALRVLVVLALFGFPVALVLAWAFEVTPEGVRRTSASWLRPAWLFAAGLVLAGAAWWGWSARQPDGEAAAGASRTSSVAVLPFASRSPDPDDAYFASGLSDELIHWLVRVRGLKVTARTSAFALEGAGLEARQIGDSLGVGAVLEGSVRRSGGRIRVTAQLVDAGSGFQLWSGSFERPEGDVLAVQDSIVRAIVDALEVEMAAGDGGRREHGTDGPDDPEAYDLYLRGRHVWLQRGEPRRALELFREAVDRDPAFARAWAGLADAYTILGSRGDLPPDEAHPAARAAAERAVGLDPRLGEAHAALAAALADYYWEWEAARRHLDRAVELAPSYATGHELRAELLSRIGRHREAVRAARRARELDPLSEPARASLIHALRLAGRHREALREARRQRDAAPEYPYADLNLGLVLLDMGRAPEAAGAFRRAVERQGEAATPLALLGVARARSGRREAARSILARLAGREAGGAAPVHAAFVHTALGEAEAALDALEAGLEERHWLMGTLASEPVWTPLRGRPRFGEILRRVGLARYAG